MLGKLLKNEIKSYRFSIAIVLLSLVLVTVCMKLISLLPYQTDIRELIQGFSAIGYYYIAMIANTAAVVLAVIHFYSTMVGDRGYLTWTLPASSETHLWVKLIGSTLVRIFVGIVTLAFMTFFYSGRYWGFYLEFISAESDFPNTGSIVIDVLLSTFRELADVFQFKYIFTIFLFLLTALVGMVLPMLLFYMCIAVGQLFGKWRILASVGCYFGITILLQILVVVAMVICTMASVGVGDYIFPFGLLENLSPYAQINTVIMFALLVEAAGAAILFAITNWIFKRHLNLE